jgi:hypothetical protein
MHSCCQAPWVFAALPSCHSTQIHGRPKCGSRKPAHASPGRSCDFPAQSVLRVRPDLCAPLFLLPERALGHAFASRSLRPPRGGALGAQREAYLPSPHFRRRSVGRAVHHRLHRSQRPACRTVSDAVDTVDMQWAQYRQVERLEALIVLFVGDLRSRCSPGVFAVALQVRFEEGEVQGVHFPHRSEFRAEELLVRLQAIVG